MIWTELTQVQTSISTTLNIFECLVLCAFYLSIPVRSTVLNTKALDASQCHLSALYEY